MHDAGEGETAATDSVAETLPQTGSGAANPLIQDNDGDEDDENGQTAWSKYEALKAKATTLSAVEMDALAQWKWLNGRLGEAIDSYLELARAHPKYLHVHFKLGYLYLILQNYESAIQHLTLEMDKQAHLPPLTNVRRAKILARKYGKLLLLQRRPAPALGKFSDCRRVAPALSEDLFQAMLGEAVANMRLQKPSVAQSILQKIIDSLSPMVEQGKPMAADDNVETLLACSVMGSGVFEPIAM
ncbi:hypothetical protein DYB32_007065 [Aphanomyces invadans]|uniref:Uncharacterized protein n=1 Tax=Aphanomyces invadans TaxID=157072 RepID=A0A418AQ28_9STRA|nr:hypothetical protein DYB32_007065 [Aphanomyces invadans]